MSRCGVFLVSAVLGAVLALAGGCSPKNAGVPAETGSTAWEAECERSFLEFDSLASARASDPAYPRARLLEARELRGAALSLYLDGSFMVALELIDEALTLLRFQP